MEPFVGEIRAFGFNFVPVGWFICNGILLPINRYTALFSLLGTNYGGDGRTTFGLPDLRGRIALGQRPDGGEMALASVGGVANVALQPSEMPLHNHSLQARVVTNTNAPMTGTPSAATFLSRTTMSPNTPAAAYAKTLTGGSTVMNDAVIQVSGQGMPHENRQPYTALLFCIAYEGVYPQRP